MQAGPRFSFTASAQAAGTEILARDAAAVPCQDSKHGPWLTHMLDTRTLQTNELKENMRPLWDFELSKLQTHLAPFGNVKKEPTGTYHKGQIGES